MRGWATLDRHVAETHEKNGHIGKWHNVEVKTLAEVCAEYEPENIHFLKIDVEGLEISVLKGNDWSKYRPWIVVVEATFPNTQIDRYSDLEELLVAENYVFAYADGLNRFYVSAEHIELLPSLKYPPNIFDDYQTYSEYSALQEVKIFEKKNISLLQDNVKITEEYHLLSQKNLSLSAENERVSIANNLLSLENEKLSVTNNELSKKYEVILEHVKKLEHENAITKKYVGEILNSTSWRITAPVRLIGQLKHGKKNDSTLKHSWLSKKLIRKLINQINKHPKLRYQIVNIIKKIGLYSIVRSAYLGVFINNAS
ncbi:FkbM family methyltransferase [Citrobacter enshiensis]|nr:FkbM family methyltransferase [Citrobacter enshiensis]